MSAAVVATSYGSESFLASGIPLQKVKNKIIKQIKLAFQQSYWLEQTMKYE